MFPTFVLLDRTFSMYAVMAVAGLLLAGWLLCRTARRLGLDTTDAMVVGLVVCCGILAGGHILYGIVEHARIPALFQQTTLRGFLEALVAAFGGSVFYGGLMGGYAAAWISLTIKKENRRIWSDALAPSVPLFHGFARIGCFLGGCCYGVEWRYGFISHGALNPSGNGVPRFPVQLMEAAFNFLLCAVLCWLSRKGKCRGRLFQIYLLCYTVFRFGDEFLRGDSYRGFWGGLSTSQWISILLFLAALVSLVCTKPTEKA